MNYGIVFKNLGMILVCEGLALVLPLLIAIGYQETSVQAFGITIVLALVGGFILYRIHLKDTNIYYSDGLAIVSLGWIVVSLVGALPFWLSGSIPSYINSLFESASGFSTTGASILTSVEGYEKSILFWRSFTHWLGGMGILVFVLAILPNSGAGAFRILAAESPGPEPDKIAPKLKETAEILYRIYIGLTVIEFALLYLSGLNWLDAAVHTFGSVGTGGFSNYNNSVASLNNPMAEWIIIVFMFLCGMNFALHYLLLAGKFKAFFKDSEALLYTCVVLISSVCIFALVYADFPSVHTGIRGTLFQVISILTTTGYATVDYNYWPMFAQILLLLLMIIGGCAGSTSGGFKQVRVLLLVKLALRGIKKKISPRVIHGIRVRKTYVREDILTDLLMYFLLYTTLLLVAILLVAIDNKDFSTTISAVVATFNNIGPGFAEVGPAGNFSHFSNFSKGVFIFIMLAGRLEIFPMVLLFVASFWRKANL